MVMDKQLIYKVYFSKLKELGKFVAVALFFLTSILKASAFLIQILLCWQQFKKGVHVNRDQLVLTVVLS